MSISEIHEFEEHPLTSSSESEPPRLERVAHDKWQACRDSTQYSGTRMDTVRMQHAVQGVDGNAYRKVVGRKEAASGKITSGHVAEERRMVGYGTTQVV